jgi:hypothetical protein
MIDFVHIYALLYFFGYWCILFNLLIGGCKERGVMGHTVQADIKNGAGISCR